MLLWNMNVILVHVLRSHLRWLKVYLLVSELSCRILILNLLLLDDFSIIITVFTFQLVK